MEQSDQLPTKLCSIFIEFKESANYVSLHYGTNTIYHMYISIVQ